MAECDRELARGLRRSNQEEAKLDVICLLVNYGLEEWAARSVVNRLLGSPHTLRALLDSASTSSSLER